MTGLEALWLLAMVGTALVLMFRFKAGQASVEVAAEHQVASGEAITAIEYFWRPG